MSDAGRGAAPVRVSIVVNNYNYERYLGRAIDSALAQSYPHVEVIVVDDGSSDGSLGVVEGYGGRVVAVAKPNGGQGSALNAGFAASGGQIVLFLDADDLLHPEAVARVVAAWRPGVAKAQFRLQFIDAEGRRVEGSHPHPAHPMPNGDVTRDILERAEYVFSPTSGNAFAREVLEAILPMPAEQWRISADVYLVYLAPFYGDVVSLDEVLGYYRVHGQNNWAHDQPDPARLAGTLATDLKKQAIILDAARRRSIPASPELILNSPWHVYGRIMHLLQSPESSRETHSLGELVAKGLRSTWRHPLSSVQAKVAATVWLAVLPVVPRPVATRISLWRLYASQRPAVLRRLARLVGG